MRWRLGGLLFLLAALGCQKIVEFEPSAEVGAQCSDGVDNDDNGSIDCADQGCSGGPECTAALCGNGRIDLPFFGFSAGVSIAVGGGPLGLGAARVNGDEAIDVIVATGRDVRELRNNNGALVAGTPLDLAAAGPVLAMSLARLDAGASDDVAVLIGGNTRAVLPVLNDAGTFRAGRPAVVSDMPVAIVAGAFDRGAGDDVMVGATESGVFFANSGAATFSSTIPQLPAQPSAFAAGDHDGDGDVDLIAVSRIRSQVYLLTNVGAATTPFPFRADRPATTGADAGAVVFVAVDDDRDLDAVVLEERDRRATVYVNRGDGTLAAGASLALTGSPTSVVAADLDLDGLPDLAIGLGSGSILLYRGDGNGGFAPAGNVDAAGADALLAVSLDGVRGPELVVAERSVNRVTVFANVSVHEDCDDANTMSGDGCNADCTLP